jgi:hypothetical protein
MGFCKICEGEKQEPFFTSTFSKAHADAFLFITKRIRFYTINKKLNH